MHCDFSWPLLCLHLEHLMDTRSIKDAIWVTFQPFIAASVFAPDYMMDHSRRSPDHSLIEQIDTVPVPERTDQTLQLWPPVLFR
jgi:hypothetical protein